VRRSVRRSVRRVRRRGGGGERANLVLGGRLLLEHLHLAAPEEAIERGSRQDLQVLLLVDPVPG
jgi:hypothetical protein